jgi:hypothetical protein
MTSTSFVAGVEEEFGFVPRYRLCGESVSLEGLFVALSNVRSLTIDYAAINVFLRTEFYLNGRTPFLELTRYAPSPIIVTESEIARDDAIDAYVDLFSTAVRRRLGDANTVALSGGRDSRHILLELQEQRAPRLRAVSVDLEMNSDGAIAQQITALAGVEHLVVPPSRSIEAAFYTVRKTGLMSTEHAWMAEVAKQRDDSIWWDGIAGDVLSAGHFLTDWNVKLYEEGRLEELADRIVAPGKIPYFRDQSLFPRMDAVKSLYEELTRHVNAANPVGSFYFWNRTRGNVGASAFGLLRPKGRITAAPFLDRDLWQFLASLPLRHVVDYQFHTDAIKRAYPRFADIPFAGRRQVERRVQRRNALRLLGALMMERPRHANWNTFVRVLAAVMIPSRASTIDWLLPAWVYGQTVERLVSGLAAR